MIKLQKKKHGIIVKDPTNLIPLVFKCKDCGCTIRKLEQTQSYVLMSIPKSIEEGVNKICPFCYKLKTYRGVE